MMPCESKLAKIEAINSIFTQNKFSNLMHWEANVGKREAINWNAYTEQVQELGALWGKIGKSRGFYLKCLRRTSSVTWCVVRQNWAKYRLLIELLTQNKFIKLMRCEAKLGKIEAINWNAYAEKIQRPDALWGRNGKSRGFYLKCLRRTNSVTWCVVRQNWAKYRLLIELLTQNKFIKLMRCEAKLGKIEVFIWNAYEEQVR